MQQQQQQPSSQSVSQSPAQIADVRRHGFSPRLAVLGLHGLVPTAAGLVAV